MKLQGLACALYLRRSTDEHQAASLDVQRSEGRAWIEREGGTLAQEHVFTDDAISRAEFKKRPGLIALLLGAEKKAFKAVVVRDETRLGGDTFRGGLVITDLLDAGARLFYFFTGEEVRLEGAVDKFMVAARSFASELEREKTSQRTHEHLQTKARRGLNVGGRCFGYDNVEVLDGDKRAHVTYAVNQAQAKIVVEIFTRYANGEGLRTIAKDLNARAVPSPTVGRRGSGSWSYATIREMVRRERYTGRLVWGKVEKAYKGGTKVRLDRPSGEWTSVELPELRIVDEALFARVQKVGTERKPNGQRTQGTPARYLLSGLARCADCGGPITVANVKASHETVKAYICTWHKDRGASVCPNSLRRPVAIVDAALLAWLREHVLTEQVVVLALKEIRARLAAQSTATANEGQALVKEAVKLRAEIDRLVDALACSAAKPASIVAGITERQGRLDTLEARLRAAQAAPEAIGLTVRRLEKQARENLADFAALANMGPAEARKLLANLLDGPLTLRATETAQGRRYQVDGTVQLERLFLVEGVPSGSPAIRNGLPRRMGFAA